MLARLGRLQYKYLVAIVFMFGLFMDLLDSTAVNVAVPKLQADFHAPLSSVEWAVTGYLLSLALFIPGSGFLSDRFGTKRIFLTAMAIFIAGSALCGQARSIEELGLSPGGRLGAGRHRLPGAVHRDRAARIAADPRSAPVQAGVVRAGHGDHDVVVRRLRRLHLPADAVPAGAAGPLTA